MESSLDNEAAVVRYKLERFRTAPRRWSYWIAAFTAANGLLLATSQDIVFLAGLIAPFQAAGAAWHFVTAGAVVALGSFEPEAGIGPGIVLIAYTIDLLWAMHLGIWTGAAMHFAVLAFVVIAWNGARILEQRLSTSAGDKLPSKGRGV